MKKTRAKGAKPTRLNLPITRPTLDAFSAYVSFFKESIKTGKLTSHKFVQEFEEKAAKYLGVKHCVAVSSCSSGLMLTLKGLDLKGEVIVPSFTFAATAHPLLWNNLTPVFADVDPKTYTIDPKEVEKLITPRTSAILATHAFGVMCDVKKLEAIARKHKLRLIFDAAHAFGSAREGAKTGNFGDAEVFSLSPIKVLTAAEGGLVATNNEVLAQYVRMGRNYGDDGTNNMLFAGLSARMSEFHGAIALRSLGSLNANLKNRRAKSAYLKKALVHIEPSLQFQVTPNGSEVTNYIFTIVIDPKVLGYTRDDVKLFLSKEGIDTRKYFFPPLHTQPPYVTFAPKAEELPVTDYLTNNILALPMYSHITKEDIDRVVRAFKKFKSMYGSINKV